MLPFINGNLKAIPKEFSFKDIIIVQIVASDSQCFKSLKSIIKQKMKKIFIILAVFISLHVVGWGVTGHRTVGYIAEQHLTKKAKKQISRILEGQSLAIISIWMDEIKSDSAYDHTYAWHYVTIPDGQTYQTCEKNEKGDIIEAIERMTASLKKGGLDRKTEAEHIKMITHLIGDIHMPLHVGNGTDKGGNDVKLNWFWEDSNLHRVWDSGIIDKKKLSYTELANSINRLSKEEVKKLQNSTVTDWTKESMALRNACYKIGEEKKINYKYSYQHWPTVQERLLQAGVRLAGVLNAIYG